MREIFTSGSVGRAPGNRCLYPEVDRKDRAPAETWRWRTFVATIDATSNLLRFLFNSSHLQSVIIILAKTRVALNATI
jgi:hypothetical protein